MQHRQVAAALDSRAIRRRTLERDQNAIGGGIGGRRGANRARRHSFGNQAASDAAEIAAIEKISTRILAERQDERI